MVGEGWQREREKAQTGEQSNYISKEMSDRSIKKALTRSWRQDVGQVEQTRFCVSAQIVLWVKQHSLLFWKLKLNCDFLQDAFLLWAWCNHLENNMEE